MFLKLFNRRLIKLGLLGDALMIGGLLTLMVMLVCSVALRLLDQAGVSVLIGRPIDNHFIRFLGVSGMICCVVGTGLWMLHVFRRVK
jgi:uncharacterized BrkB/YihY/UPF0761 family membrane protein